MAANISARQQRWWRRKGEGQGDSAVFCHEAFPGCIIVVAVVDVPMSALASFSLPSPLPFPSPLLFPLPPSLQRRRFFCCRFEAIVVCAPHNHCCRRCLCRHHCHRCHCCCCCHCCHHRPHRSLTVIVLAFVVRLGQVYLAIGYR
jgi:hypothetical protein